MLILVVTTAVVVAVVLTVAFGMFLWRLARGERHKSAVPHRSVNREFRKIARRIGRLEPPSDED